MHICIPDTREVRPPSGSAYLLYNVHIDGLYHCSLRYKQLHHLHQALGKRFPSGNPEGVTLPPFPPKKLLPLTQGQVEDRRQLLEKYLQNISQDKTISNSSLFNMYLLEAQRESSARLVDANRHVHLDIELVNGQKIRLPIVSQDSVDSVLTACCRSLGLADQHHAYFCLCLCGYDVVSDKLIIKRRLSFFEAPFLTLQMAIQQQEHLQSALSAPASHQGLQQEQHLQYQRPSNHDHNHHHHNHPHRLHYGQSPLAHSNGDTGCRCSSCVQQQTSRVPLVASSSVATYCRSRCCCCPSTASSQQVAPGHSTVASSTRGSLVTHRILLRKSYWDPIYDTYILKDPQALALLFIQTVYDMKHSLMFVNRATYQRLESLLAADSKLDYILLARTLKYYNYVHFEPCYSDYPRPRTKVMISIGSRELNMRVLRQPTQNGPRAASSIPANGLESPQGQNGQQPQQDQEVLYCTSSLVPHRGQRQLVTREDLIEEEYNFKVPLIRCWRLTSLETLSSSASGGSGGGGAGVAAQQARQAPAATTTLAGGKRRSLSLFNSVLGNSGTSANGNSSSLSSSQAECNPSASVSGTGGSSLMATLLPRTGDSNNLNGSSLLRQGDNHQANATTSSCNGAPTDSFLRFSSNANQISATSNNHSPGQQHLSQQQHNSNQQHHNHHHHEQELTQLSQYELSFEYLIAKDTLKWITISSDQAIFISISLQGVVDELVSRREALGALSILPSAAAVATSNGAGRAIFDGHSPAVSRPIAIQNDRRAASRQLAESFTYLYQDGGQKSIKAKSQQQLLDRFCNGGVGSALSSSAPPASAAFAVANSASARQQRNQGNHEVQASGQSTTADASNSSFISSPPRRSSILQVAGFWGSSPPGRYYGHQSSSGTHGQAFLTSSGNGHGAAPFEFGHHYHYNTRRASGHNSKCKAPSPIINDAFEGVVSTDDDF